MNFTTEQLQSDRSKMVRFICERIPADGTTVILADDSGEPAWAGLHPTWDDEGSWDLRIETNEPEWVGLKEVFDLFRRQEKTWGEWGRGLAAESQRWRRQAELDKIASDTSPQIVDGKELPKEVSTAEAARILGISKDSVLKLKEAGLLEYRNLAPPPSSRAIFRFLLASVMELRNGYQTDFPAPPFPHQPRRRGVRQGQQAKFKHLRVD